jgi:hypothetical protein
MHDASSSSPIWQAFAILGLPTKKQIGQPATCLIKQQKHLNFEGHHGTYFISSQQRIETSVLYCTFIISI